MFIYTERALQTSVSWQIIREWEEDFSNHLKIPLQNFKTTERTTLNRIRYHKKIYPLWNYLTQYNTTGCLFEMVSPYYYGNHTGRSIIPIIVDVWKHDLSRLEEFCKYHPILFLGSLEAVEFLNKKGWKNVYYFPVCISNRHLLDKNIELTKSIDLILFGRTHHKLREWVRKLYHSSSFHIIECNLNSKGKVVAHSNVLGEINNLTNRSDFFKMIQSSKYTIVSAPGIDIEDEHDQLRTGGFSPVTPRFFECAVNYSIGIGFFPDNPDYNACAIKDFSIQIKNYNHLLDILNSDYKLSNVKESALHFLKNHWSTNRAEFLKSKILEMK